MTEPADMNGPLVNTDVARRDVGAVVDVERRGRNVTRERRFAQETSAARPGSSTISGLGDLSLDPLLLLGQ